MVVRVAGRSIPLSPRWAWGALRREFERTPTALRIWFTVLVVLMLVGAAGAVRALWPGDKGLATTPTFEWGLLIVGYVFFAVTTSGLCLASSLGTVFGIDRFRPLEKRHAVLALLCLITAFGLIAIDLHYPIRMVFGAVFSPSPASAMWWMGVFYAAYLVFLMTEVWSIFWRHPRIHQWACLMASITAIIAPATLGAVFAVVASRSSWAGMFTPLQMVANAFVSGTALLAIVFFVVGRLRLVGWQRGTALAVPAIRLLLTVGLVLVSALVARQLYVGMTSPDAGMRSATEALLSGPLAPEFVGVRLVGGLAVPLLLVVLPWTRTSAGLLVAGCLSIVGVFADRLTFVEAGQIAPVTTVAGVVSTPYAAYSPSLVEISIMVGAVALVAFMYTLAERYLDLSESEAHVFIWLPRGSIGRLRERLAPRTRPVAEQEPAPAVVGDISVEPPPEPIVAQGEPVAPEPAVEFEVAAEAEPATQPEPEVIPEPEPEVTAEPEPDAELVPEPEPEPAPEPEQEPESQIEPEVAPDTIDSTVPEP